MFRCYLESIISVCWPPQTHVPRGQSHLFAVWLLLAGRKSKSPTKMDFKTLVSTWGGGSVGPHMRTEFRSQHPPGNARCVAHTCNLNPWETERAAALGQMANQTWQICKLQVQWAPLSQRARWKVGKTAQQVIALATKADCLSYTPRTHSGNREPTSTVCPLTSIQHMCAPPPHTWGGGIKRERENKSCSF